MRHKDMRKLIFGIAGILIAGTVFTMTGCAVYPAQSHHYGYGPPPHAPAHGYRAKYHNHDLVYDSHLGVYLVIGLHDHYYRDGYYYRYAHDGWYSSRYVDKDWGSYEERKLPPGLAKKYSGKRKGKY
jgi:hypothetical protein